ncbi:MAG: substrate-binding domain-containing protein [bacterium]
MNTGVQARLDAAIFLGPFEQRPLRRMIETGPPAVLLDHELRGAHVDAILVDNRGGGYQAIDHLISIGHRALAVICGPDEQGISRDRLMGVHEVLESSGLPKSALRAIPGTFERESGYRAMARMIEGGPDNIPTGIFCLNDEMAAGAMQALHAMTTLRVPEDISIVGFDDTSWATATQPPLTTIHIPRQFMGRLAVRRVISRLNDTSHTATTTIAATNLVLRGSHAVPPRRYRSVSPAFRLRSTLRRINAAPCLPAIVPLRAGRRRDLRRNPNRAGCGTFATGC